MSLPNSKSQTMPGEREKVKAVVARRGLCGLANDTKWDEFINAMRSQVDQWIQQRAWLPNFRFKCVDGPPSAWDCEWSYHLPFPMISTEWFDIACIQEISDNRLPRNTHRIDHSAWIEELLNKVGLEYHKGKEMIRVFGYSPKDWTLFDA
jgi:hypothetical protein